MKTVTIGHGNGGKLGHDLVTSLIVPAFASPELADLSDSARIALPAGASNLVFTTDSFVVSPLVFPGGDIGKLAVTGTVNDLAVMGATPLFLSSALIIEEGLPFDRLRDIVGSMARTAETAGVRIVTGDTKVVPRGAADQLFINTAGIGVLAPNAPAGPSTMQPGDAVILSGSVGDHGIAIYAGREGIDFQTDLASDCAVVTELARLALSRASAVRVMRDPTRGGLATTVNEFVSGRQTGIELFEDRIPVKEEVRGACELLGFDPLYVANEGKIVLVVPGSDADAVVEAFRAHPLGKEAAVIGRVTEAHKGKVTLKTVVGGERLLDMLVGEMLPRIC